LTVPYREPLLPRSLPSYPWEHDVVDIFELKGSTYLLIADYYSRFVGVQKLTTTISSSIVTHLKAIFARFRIPTILAIDNGPQFDTQVMKEFDHAISSSTQQQVLIILGLAERIVKLSRNC